MDIINPVNPKPARDHWLVYFLIALFIIVFNLISIIGPQTLLADDANFYGGYQYRSVTQYLIGKGMIVKAFFKSIYIGLLTISPLLIRSVFLGLLMIPISIIFFRLLRTKFGFSSSMAFFAVLIPNILPAQWPVPAYISGSYMIIGLLIIIVAFMLGFRFLDKAKYSGIWLPVCFILYLIAGLQMEQAVFFMPIFFIAYIGYRRIGKRHFILLGMFLISAAGLTALYMSNPRGTVRPEKWESAQYILRIKKYFLSHLPLPESLKGIPLILGILVAALLIAGFILVLKRKGFPLHQAENNSRMSPSLFTLYIFGFLCAWYVCNIFAFVFFSKLQTPRYGFISGYGLAALLVLSLFAISHFISNSFKPAVVLLTLTVLVSGAARYQELKAQFDKLGNSQSVLQQKLAPYTFPPHSQIIIQLSHKRKPYRCNHLNSVGHMMYMLKRTDINGILLDPKTFSREKTDPFTLETTPVERLSPTKPLFIFIEKEKGLVHIPFILRWIRRKRGSLWTIYHMDPINGALTPIAWGRGDEKYARALKWLQRAEITRGDIFWSGHETSD